jgi:hypothetical protein
MIDSKEAPASVCRDESDPAEKYESLPLDQVMDDLRRHGIDPRPTIKRVTALVRSKIEAWEHRKKS